MTLAIFQGHWTVSDQISHKRCVITAKLIGNHTLAFGSSIAVWRHSTTSFIGWMYQRGSLTRWVSWCTAVFTVRYLGTSPTISSHPPTPARRTSLSTQHNNTAVGRFRSLVRRPGTRCLMSSEIQHVVLTVLSSFLRQSCLVFTNVTSALEVFLNVMRYINPRFTCFTYLLSIGATFDDLEVHLKVISA